LGRYDPDCEKKKGTGNDRGIEHGGRENQGRLALSWDEHYAWKLGDRGFAKSPNRRKEKPFSGNRPEEEWK